jgi:hypothetical protein
MADLYVRKDGNDGNSGSADTAAGAKLTIAAAITAASSGDDIWVRAGTYEEAGLDASAKALGFHLGRATVISGSIASGPLLKLGSNSELYGGRFNATGATVSNLMTVLIAGDDVLIERPVIISNGGGIATDGTYRAGIRIIEPRIAAAEVCISLASCTFHVLRPQLSSIGWVVCDGWGIYVPDTNGGPVAGVIACQGIIDGATIWVDRPDGGEATWSAIGIIVDGSPHVRVFNSVLDVIRRGSLTTGRSKGLLVNGMSTIVNASNVSFRVSAPDAGEAYEEHVAKDDSWPDTQCALVNCNYNAAKVAGETVDVDVAIQAKTDLITSAAMTGAAGAQQAGEAVTLPTEAAGKIANLPDNTATTLAALATTVGSPMQANDTSVAAIKAKTDNLPEDTQNAIAAVQSEVGALLEGINTMDGKLTTERLGKIDGALQASGYTAPDNTSIGQIKAKTDLITADAMTGAAGAQQAGEAVTLPETAPDGYGTVVRPVTVVEQ